jgi:hypothetical protein
MDSPINKNILQKLHAIMTDVSFIEKDKKNLNQNYLYASEYAIKVALHRQFVEKKVLFQLETRNAGIVEGKTFIDCQYKFYDVESGESLSGNFNGAGQARDEKGFYAAVTGAIKYILTSTFLIPTGDDPEKDSLESKAPATTKRPAKPLSKEDKVYADLKGKILLENDIAKLEQYKNSLVEKSDVVTPTQFKDLISQIDSKLHKFSKKDTKQDSRNSAEIETQDIESIQVEE